MTAAIAGFVQGLFQGADWREGREDRARKRKIEDELLAQDRQRFEWEKGDQAYQLEQRGAAREDRAFEVSERKRALNKRSAEEAAWNATVDELMGAAAPAQIGAASPPRPVPQSPASVQVPAQAVPFSTPRPEDRAQLGYGVAGDVVRGAAERENVAGDPAADRLGMPQQSGGAAMPDARPAQAMSAGPAFEQTGRNPAVLPGISIMDLGIEASQKNAAAQAAAAGPDFEQSGRRDRTAGERRALGVWDAVKETSGSIAGAAKDTFVGGLNTYGAAVGAPASSTVKEIGGLAASAVGATGAGAAAMDSADQDRKRAQDWLKARRVQGAAPAPAASPAAVAPGGQKPETVASPAPVPQAGADRLAFSQVPKTQEGTPMVSLSMGRELGILGKDGAVKATPSQRGKAATGFVSSYQREKMPAIVQHYLRNGEVEKAQAFEEWMQDRGVKQGMKAWASAVHAFSLNDIDGVLDGLAEANNAPNYYDDGLSVIREKSKPIYAGNGDLLGVSITWRNDATGEEFAQNVEGINDLMAVGVGLLAPEKAFEIGWSATVGAKKTKPKAINPKDVMAAVESRSLSDPAFAALPFEQRERITTEAFSRIQGDQGSTYSTEDVPLDLME